MGLRRFGQLCGLHCSGWIGLSFKLWAGVVPSVLLGASGCVLWLWNVGVICWTDCIFQPWSGPLCSGFWGWYNIPESGFWGCVDLGDFVGVELLRVDGLGF